MAGQLINLDHVFENVTFAQMHIYNHFVQASVFKSDDEFECRLLYPFQQADLGI